MSHDYGRNYPWEIYCLPSHPRRSANLLRHPPIDPFAGSRHAPKFPGSRTSPSLSGGRSTPRLL